MTTSNEFRDYYKSISNSELLSILDNPGIYQPMAVEAAKEEYSNRQFSESDIQEAREPQIARQVKREKQKEKVKELEFKVKATGHSFIDTINPIQTEIHSTEKTIRLILIVFGGLYIYGFIKDFSKHFVYLRDILRFPYESIPFLLPKIVLPIALYAFWKRKPFGWVLLSAYVSYASVGAIGLLIQALNWKPIGFGNLDNLFPRPSLTTHIVQLLFLVGVIYILCKTNIREVYGISKQKMTATIGITGVVTCFILFAIS